MADRYLKNPLGKNEQILFIARQHWLILFSEILSETILTIALTILITLVWQLWLPNSLIPLAYLLLLFPLVSLFRDVLIWASHQYVITNWRVIQLKGVLNKEVTDSSLEKVNDVKLEQSFWGRLLDYGNVEILTASEMGVNKFRKVGQPIRLKTVMLNAKEKLEQGQAGSRRGSKGDITDLIAQLDSLRKQGLLSEEEFQRKKTQLLEKL